MLDWEPICGHPGAARAQLERLRARYGKRGAALEEAQPRQIEIVVDRGYQPGRVVIQQGERVRLRFVRNDYSPCTGEVVFPSLGIRRELPVEKPVLIDRPALAPGAVEFHCGMNIVRETIVVEARR